MIIGDGENDRVHAGRSSEWWSRGGLKVAGARDDFVVVARRAALSFAGVVAARADAAVSVVYVLGLVSTAPTSSLLSPTSSTDGAATTSPLLTAVSGERGRAAGRLL